jgi:two-component system OmpR family sensor kinase
VTDEPAPSPRIRSRLRRRTRALLHRADLTASRITALYLLLGFAALYLSDVLFVRWFSDPLLGQIQAVKGAAEVLLTGAFIYAITTLSRSQLADTADRIERQRHELDVLHRVFRHNLRNDLTVLAGYAELVREEVDSESLAAACDTIVDRSGTLERYTEQAARIRNLSGEEARTTVDLATRVPELVARHEQVTGTVAVTIDVPETCRVQALPEIEDAIRELLTNAVEHADRPDVDLAVAVDPSAGPDHVVECRITDNGPGIPETELAAIERGASDQVVHLSGLGLCFVYWTVRRSGGTIEFESVDPAGTCVRIQLLRADAPVVPRERPAGDLLPGTPISLV